MRLGAPPPTPMANSTGAQQEAANLHVGSCYFLLVATLYSCTMVLRACMLSAQVCRYAGMYATRTYIIGTPRIVRLSVERFPVG